jgi:integrase
MKLSDVKLRTAKPRDKAYKLADGGGLYIEIYPNGSKLWRLKYRREDGTETRLSLGPYPANTLTVARTKRESLKQQKREGVDPSNERRSAKARRMEAAENSFEAVAREWLDKFSGKKSEEHTARMLRRFERDLFPYIGRLPIAEVTAPELLSALRRIESRGAIETAHRARGDSGAVFRYAIATGRAKHDISTDLRGALATAAKRHFAAIIDPSEVGALLRAIDGYKGTAEVRAALKLAPLVFTRPGELRNAEWAEIDLDKAEWTIPAEKMKMRVQHLVPLSVQVVGILRELHALTGRRQYVFPSARSPRRPMSEVAVLAALRRMGYSNSEMTGHGFRAMARTILDEELGFRQDIIEHQLAHAVKDPNGRAYNRTSHLPERRKMMQAWADYLDVLKEQRKVVAGKFGKAA